MLDKAEYSAFQSTLNSSIVSYRIVSFVAIVDLFVKSGSSPQLSADDAIVQHQMALWLHGDYTKWAWLSFSAATPPICSLVEMYNTFNYLGYEREVGDWPVVVELVFV